MRRAASIAALACVVLVGSSASVAVELHGLFTDNMVLQQGRKVPVWGTGGDGEKVSVSIAGTRAEATTKGGTWMAWLDPLKAGGPFEMTIRGANTVTLRNVLVGEVWVASGQSNMAMQLNACANAQEEMAKSANPKIRLFTVERTTSDKPLTAVNTKLGWVECGPKTTGGFSAVAYFFGRDLEAALKVPAGMIHTSWGGSPAEAWTDSQTLASNPQLQKIVDAWHHYIKYQYPKMAKAYEAKLTKWKQDAAQAKAEGKKPPGKPRAPAGPDSHRQPSSLYNGMIHPLVPYAIRGAIWYQGEANAGRAYEYRTLFPAMITNWRGVWKQGDFPFLLVQLAPFEGKSPVGTWPELREAQLLTTQKRPNVGMAVITDVGDRKDIHPKRKAPVGARLALAARAIAYGEKIVYSGPIYDSMKVEGSTIVLSFKHVGSGLMAKGGELKGFTICGKDRTFVPAQAEIHADKVIVRSAKVADPVAVRFGWENFPVVDFWNKDGLPATPFRTDDFPMITRPK